MVDIGCGWLLDRACDQSRSFFFMDVCLVSSCCWSVIVMYYSHSHFI